MSTMRFRQTIIYGAYFLSGIIHIMADILIAVLKSNSHDKPSDTNDILPKEKCHP